MPCYEQREIACSCKSDMEKLKHTIMPAAFGWSVESSDELPPNRCQHKIQIDIYHFLRECHRRMNGIEYEFCWNNDYNGLKDGSLRRIWYMLSTKFITKSYPNYFKWFRMLSVMILALTDCFFLFQIWLTVTFLLNALVNTVCVLASICHKTCTNICRTSIDFMKTGYLVRLFSSSYCRVAISSKRANKVSNPFEALYHKVWYCFLHWNALLLQKSHERTRIISALSIDFPYHKQQ